MIPQRFGESAPFTVGVEQELMILDAATYDQVGEVAQLLERARGIAMPGTLKTELFASIVETNTGVCGSAAELATALPALRRAAAEAAAADGRTVAAAAAHPFARPEEQPIVQEPRYLTFEAYGGISVRRQGVQGLHVHVGMPSADDCWRCLEAVLPWLPVVLALSVNSPWLAGVRTGLLSNRAPVLGELPRAGVVPAFSSYAEWEGWVERLVAFGLAEDDTRFWWDVRPHPRLGTLEIRVPDQQTDVLLSVAFAALLQALCAAALAGRLAPAAQLGDQGRADYVQNRWAAARFGPAADLIHPDGSRAAPAHELGAELLELVAADAASLGGADALARLDPMQCEAELQLAFDDPVEATADLVTRTLG